MKEKKRLKQFSSFGLFLFLLLTLIGGSGCQKEEVVDWKEGIEGSVFRDFETVLFVDTIPETVDKENAVYLYYQTEKAHEFEYPGYFHYSKAYPAAVHDGTKYYLSDENEMVKHFISANTISVSRIKIHLSGYITKFIGATLGGDTIYLLEVTNIKVKEE